MKRVSDIDLRLLRIFVTVAEAGGFAAAKSYLNVSTSTISVHMSNLEKRLGLRLCERGRGGFQLTERGKVIYQETKAFLRTLDDFSGVLAGAKHLLAGRLVIGMVDCLVTHPEFPVADAVRRFNEVDNDVQIELLVGSRQTLEHEVVEGRIHAAIGPFVRNISGLNFVPVFKERHEVYCGVGHPLFHAAPKTIAEADLADFSSILRMYHYDFDRDQLSAISEKALIYSMEAMLTLLLSGGYIGFLPTHYAEPFVAANRLSPIDRPELVYEFEHMLITKRGGRESRALATFASIVTELCAANAIE